MPTDILRAYANERVDLVDFDFLADSGFQENLRQPMEQFFTDPAGQRAWILDGFTIANPSGDQVEVTKGRAILGQREGALVFYGALTVEGDATKTIDMSTLTPNANYGLYVRFEYVDGDTSSRIFWNPAGTGSEVAQAVATRRKANWSIRIELTNPGSEYLKIATLDNTGIGVAITDERPLYFEGDVHNSYQSGWSSDGGGAANDRNADRQQYGVKDFQTFTAAMRQCLEDIKGRGLRRWWERTIGGMNIGFDSAPVEDRLAVHDGVFTLEHDGTDPFLVWGTDDYFKYDRSANLLQFVIATNPMLQIGTVGTRLTGLAINDSLGVVPADNQVRVGDTNFGLLWDGTDPYLYWDTNDYFWFDRSADTNGVFYGVINSNAKFAVNWSGFKATGIAIDSTLTNNAADNTISIGSTSFRLYWDGTDSRLYWHLNDYFYHDVSAGTLLLVLNALNTWKAEANGIRTKGIAVESNLGIAPVVDQIRCGVGSFRMEWDGTDPFIYWDTAGSNDYFMYDRSGNGLFLTIADIDRWSCGAGGVRTLGLAVSSGLALTPGTDRVTVGDTNFYMQWSGTDPFIYFDAGDWIQYDRSLITNGAWLYYINASPVMQVEGVGARVRGLAVSAALGLSPNVDDVLVGDANFGLSWDGTDPFILVDSTDYIQYDRSLHTYGAYNFYINSAIPFQVYSDGIRVADRANIGDDAFYLDFDGTDPSIVFDTATVNDRFLYDRSQNTLLLHQGAIVRHFWAPEKAGMYGSGSDSSTVLTNAGEYLYGRYSGMWTLRGPTNSGGANVNQIKALQNTLYNNIHPSGTLTNAQLVNIIDVTFNLEQVRNKTFRVTIWGNVKRVSGTNPFLVTGVLTGASSVGMGVMSFAPTSTSGVHDNQDKFHAQFLVPVQGESNAETFHCSLTGAYRIGATVTPVLDHTTGSPEDLVANRLQMQIQLQTTGTGVVDYEVCNAMVEELGGEENQDSE